MVTIDASLDELTGATIIITTTDSLCTATKRPWLTRIMDRRPAKVASVALANKIARNNQISAAAHEPAFGTQGGHHDRAEPRPLSGVKPT
jgi:hypothetical protein